ncbi:Drug resistance transporter, EmrB/QacA subfamily protein, partial [Lacticaseibacillus paracasei subsp. paracasei Lpp125]
MNSKRLRNILSFIGLSIAMFMGTLDSTIVNIALPKIMRAFGSSLNDTSWVTTIYVLSLSVFMITSSKVADRIGRKKV